MKNPIQPLFKDEDDRWVFKKNKIVEMLVEKSGVSLMQIELWDVPRDCLLYTSDAADDLA